MVVRCCYISFHQIFTLACLQSKLACAELNLTEWCRVSSSTWSPWLGHGHVLLWPRLTAAATFFSIWGCCLLRPLFALHCTCKLPQPTDSKQNSAHLPCRLCPSVLVRPTCIPTLDSARQTLVSTRAFYSRRSDTPRAATARTSSVVSSLKTAAVPTSAHSHSRRTRAMPSV